MKKIRLMALLMALSTMLLACGNAGSSGSGSDTTGEGGVTQDHTTAPSNNGNNGELQLPIVDDGSVSLSLFVTTRLGVDNYDDNTYTDWIEEQTGLKLTFVVAPEQSAEEKLNAILTSGEYPDIITGNRSIPLTQLKLYGDQGIFVELNDLIEMHGSNIKTLLQDYPEAMNIMETPEGKIYGLPDLNECYHCTMDGKMWVYEPWLKALSIDIPQTTEEFKDMLIAFKNDDPNGNGEADEIPMMGSNSGGWNAFPEIFLMNSFTYYSSTSEGLYINDGKVTAAFTEDAYKDGLKYLNGLVSEGLLAPETYTQDNNILIQNVDNPDPIIGAIPSGYMGMFTQIGASDRWQDFIAIAPVEGPDGIRYSRWNPYSSLTIKFAITDKCENLREAMMLADFFYTEEATLRNVNGEPGVGWQYLDGSTDKLGIDGKPAKYETLLGVDDLPTNTSWNQSSLTYRTAEFRLGAALGGDSAFEKPLHYMTEENYAPYQPDIEMVIGPMYFSEDQSNELITIETAVRSYIRERNAAFITGASDIDATWESYLKELENIGLPRLLEIYQEALGS